MTSIIFCDSVVVGSGPGGLTAAKRLIEAGIDTLLIEEGSLIKTAESQKFKNYDKIAKMWRNGGITTSFGKLPVLYAEGRVVGGGAEINSGIMQRAPQEVVEEWIKNCAIKNFSNESLNRYYDKVFDLISPTVPEFHPSSEILIDAAKNLGWKSDRLQIAYDKQGNKRSVSSLTLDDLLQKKLRLFSDLKVKKIIHKNGKAEALSCCAADGKKLTIKFHNLFLAAGAIYSPFLLQKSGIKKNIGKTLQFHPTLKVGALFENKINSNPMTVPGTAITEFMPNIRIGGSVFTQGYFGMFLSEDWQERSWMFNLWQNCGIYYAMIKPQGKAKIFSLPFLSDPIVLMNLTKSDEARLVKALDILIKSMFAAGAKFVYPSIYGHRGFEKYEEIKVKKITDLNLMTIHAFSSLPMGESESCPVDSFGKLKAMSNVIVCDASIIPSAPGTNPQATIMALVERNLDLFLTKKIKQNDQI